MAISQYSVTTLSAVKNYLRIDDTDTSNDAILESLIDAVSQAIETYTGRFFVRREVIEEPHEANGKIIELDHYPVSSVSTVMINASELDPGQYTITKYAGVIETDFTMEGAVLVTYTPGYSDTSADTPKDVQLAAWKWISQIFNSENPNIKSETLGDFSVTYFDIEENVPKEVAPLLENYRMRSV